MVGAIRVEQEGDGTGDLAGLRGLFLTDLRQTRLETALHLAERVGPDDRRAHRPPRQASRPAPRHGGVETCLVARTCRLCGGCEWLRGASSGRGGGGSRPWSTPSGRRRGTRRPPRTPRSGSGPVTVSTSSAGPRVRRDGGRQRRAMARGGPGRATRIVPVPWPPRPRRGTGRRAGSHARFRARTAG